MSNTDTAIPLREYVDVRFDGLECLFETKVLAQEKAIVLASNSLSVRLDLMNEFRSQLKDQAQTFFRVPSTSCPWLRPLRT